MPVGPFDGRKKRSRCLACAASHLKCSGSFPCSNCQRRRIDCVFHGRAPNQIRIVTAHDGKIAAPATQGSPCQSQILKPPGLAISLSVDQVYYLSQYFDTFLQRNNFNPRTDAFTDVVGLMKDQGPETFLHDAVLSLGAMQAVKLHSFEGVTPSESYRLAVYHYSRSVLGLRHALDKFDQLPGVRHQILWTTHFLGLFELMNDSTGQGWIQHLVHGTSKALVAAGPTTCYSGLDQRFFTEIRIFEVCRAIIFNEPTFLAQEEWRKLVQRMKESKGKDGAHSLDDLLDIIVLCSTLRVRTENFIYSNEEDSEQSEKRLDEAYNIAQEGFLLKQALVDWEANAISSRSPAKGHENSIYGSFTSLARTFFSATSIYLSGVFDYEITHWQKMGVVVPNLCEEEIQMHVATILMQADRVLHGSPVSPVLVLFPLRVAGARSWECWQQDLVMQHLTTVEQMFPVAAAFKDDLKDVWSRRGSG
ncbi:hypothetical protein BKA59DRAFT_440991 [Fusarium tricinctum]|uniref:Zn(2)-C6 fungal-type domain-containing protein n=1 Tax=Fusarium tricinctum TaxID=61284 RepID=A0A8K0W9R3_9HYPO|nr:hypothetical protein BKA59DRAFT_440991 [Fusarium tricinctum]